MATVQLGATEEAYSRAIELYKEAYPNNQTTLSKLQGTYRINDVVEVVAAAKEKYDQRTKGSKARKWLSYFSSQVTYYGQVLDVLAQHHPEYVSLAWGTMKFVFILVLNHEEMVTELSRAMSEIADVLPRVEIQLDVFKDEKSIRVAVEELYAELIKFLFRTLKWYEQSPWKHAFTAFAAPFKLRFEDLKTKINRHARRIDKLATALSQAKLAAMHRQLQILLEVQNSTNTSSKHSEEFLKRLEPMIVEIISSMTTSPSSSFIIVEGSAPSRSQTKDLATGLISVLREAGKPTVWAVNGRAALQPSEEDSVHVLKHLCSQVLQANNKQAIRQVSNHFNASRVESAVTESDWLQILQESLTGLPELFVVVDLELFGAASSSSSSNAQVLLFLRALKALLTNLQRVPVKIAAFTFRRPLLSALRSDPREATIVPLEQKRSAAAGSRSLRSKGGRKQKNALPNMFKNK
ncbi:Nacht domain protein [Lasiodiplodia theobromae]|uniref:Nacht domain protein n=1 Tax=Lasiodiplodia theobromae TaxID=45133 RepID=UPI0015C397F7|nr:Nacht domain protein [Lasiodiplodia theobromae]KAF4542778.1 Nacht domain protein [Lasiodiplodia theobromae]